MNLAEILQWLQFSQKSGTVVFENRGVVKKVFIENGLVVSGSSNDPKEYLGQILICFGWINEEALSEAFLTQKKKGVLLGKLLSTDYDVSEKKILEALRVKIEETVYDLFLWEDGKFIYTDGLGGLQVHDRLDAPIPIDRLIMEGARRQDEWNEFLTKVPNDRVVFSIKDKQKPLKELGQDHFLKIIYDAVDGTKTIRRIILETRVPEYRGMEAFGKLFFNDFLTIEGELNSAEGAGSESAPEKLKQAVSLFKDKKYPQAFDAIDGFLLVSPGHEEGQTLYKLIHQEYLKELYTKIPAKEIPELTMELSQLNERVFSSREGFIASRINGEWDVKSLTMISPLGELESLRILAKLIDEGMVRLREKISK